MSASHDDPVEDEKTKKYKERFKQYCEKYLNASDYATNKYQISVSKIKELAQYYKNNTKPNKKLKIKVNGETNSNSVLADIEQHKAEKRTFLLNSFAHMEIPEAIKEIAINEAIKNLGLSQNGCANEIKEIQATLKDDEVVGYVFTGCSLENAAHFEVLLISKDKIIKPIIWRGQVSLDSEQIPDMFVTDLDFLTKKIDLITSPQAKEDGISCGTLGMLHLKELLKNNSQQLRENSIATSFYYEDDNGVTVKNLFIPSPDVLRYSQSMKYNTLIKSLMSDQETFTVTNEKSIQDLSMEVPTLETLLKRSIEHAKKIGDNVMVNKNEASLEELKEMQQKWLGNYNKAMQRRNMYSDEVSKINRYLAYKTVKYHVKDYSADVIAPEPDRNNTPKNR